jgi:opacity protein-like surface antigen
MENRTKLFVAALLTVLTLVFAVSSPSHAYFGVKAGAFLPNDDDDGLDGFDTGYSVEGFYGYEFNPNFALEAGVGYYKSEYSDSFYEPEINATINEDDTLSVIPLTLTAKGTYPVGQGFSLFGGAGVGAYFAKVEVDMDAGGYVSVSDDDTQTAFGFHVVAGGEYKFANGMAALAEFKWLKAESDFELFDESTDDINIGGIVLSLGVKF